MDFFFNPVSHPDSWLQTWVIIHLQSFMAALLTAFCCAQTQAAFTFSGLSLLFSLRQLCTLATCGLVCLYGFKADGEFSPQLDGRGVPSKYFAVFTS